MNRWILLAGTILLIGFLALSGILRPLGDVGRAATLPLMRGLAGGSQFFSSFWPSSTRVTVDRVRELESRLAGLSVDYVRLRALEEENASLRAQAKFLASSGYDSVGARVISRDVRNQRALLVIDRGLDDHVEVGQAAVTNEGVYVGKVISVKQRVATIGLVSDPLSRIAAAVSGEKQLIGVVEGRGNGAAILTYIPSTAAVARDQIIVTAGTEDKIPRNLPLGIINSVQGKATNAFFDAPLDPLVPLDQISMVSILRPSVLRPSL